MPSSPNTPTLNLKTRYCSFRHSAQLPSPPGTRIASQPPLRRVSMRLRPLIGPSCYRGYWGREWALGFAPSPAPARPHPYLSAPACDRFTSPRVDSLHTHRPPGSQYGRTPLHLAAQLGKVPAIDALLAKNADIESKDDVLHLLPFPTAPPPTSPRRASQSPPWHYTYLRLHLFFGRFKPARPFEERASA
jgi:hypothetical protein